MGLNRFNPDPLRAGMAINGTALDCGKNGRKSQVVERQVTHSFFVKPTLKDGFTFLLAKKL